jgi:ferrous iron transport protein B
MRFALIGQPNCGKSTLFNQVAGYKAETGNFSGTTVTYTETKVRVLGEIIQLVDLPGTYSLAGTNPVEREVFSFLASHPVDVIINVLDASRVSHGLELSLELIELQRPIIIALNMMDEARRMGIHVDIQSLSKELGVPVLPVVASRGMGVRDLFVTALLLTRKSHAPKRIEFSREIEDIILKISNSIHSDVGLLPKTTTAIKLLEEDPTVSQSLQTVQPELEAEVIVLREEILEKRGQQAVWVISGERHAISTRLGKAVVQEGVRRITLRDKLDDIFLHPVFGYFFLILVLLVFFQFVYRFGNLLENPLVNLFNSLEEIILAPLNEGRFFYEIVHGLIQGISGGLAIVLPYLLPFLFGLGLLEDIGYLPRVAFLMDALMHRLGLHGKAIVPFILGYGCNVPAIMSTRIMEDRRDRFLAATLATMVPCAARLAVVFGLVAYYIGPNFALIIYLFNLFVIAITAKLLSRMLPEDSPGLILEMPVYRFPTWSNVMHKTWFRVREFIVEAWPALIIGSILLSILTFLNWSYYLNLLVRPISWLLGLPSEVGVPLIFGILRKELSMVMLRQSLGAEDLSSVMTSVQMITFSVFVVFYIPCLATLMVIKKELGIQSVLIISGLTIFIATVSALIARFSATLFRMI